MTWYDFSQFLLQWLESAHVLIGAVAGIILCLIKLKAVVPDPWKTAFHRFSALVLAVVLLGAPASVLVRMLLLEGEARKWDAEVHFDAPGER